MAALYLHQALFTQNPITPPAPARHSFSGHSSHGRHLSSVSSMTLRAPTPDHLLPTEPSLHSLDSASSVYLGLLARQPQHPTACLRSGTRVALDLEGDPETIGERKSRWERAVRRRLRRLRWTKWILLVVIGMNVVLCNLHREPEATFIIQARGGCTTPRGITWLSPCTSTVRDRSSRSLWEQALPFRSRSSSPLSSLQRWPRISNGSNGHGRCT